MLREFPKLSIRLFNSSSVGMMPRAAFNPRLQPLEKAPKTPKLEDLAAPLIKAEKYVSYPSRKYMKPHERLSLPKVAKRSLTEIETARALPITFQEGETIKDYKTKPLICEKLKAGEYHFPYRYYEICLRRGLVGLPQKTKHIVQSLGLTKRHQVVWRLVSPKSAGQILKIKELVTIRLVNEIPERKPPPTGFKLISSKTW
jgi:large subunit ribosomal protein L30